MLTSVSAHVRSVIPKANRHTSRRTRTRSIGNPPSSFLGGRIVAQVRRRRTTVASFAANAWQLAPGPAILLSDLSRLGRLKEC